MERKYNIIEITSKADMCMAHACSGIYEDQSNKYLIIGKKANPSDFGLEKKVGKDEVLIEIPKKIIDNRRK